MSQHSNHLAVVLAESYPEQLSLLSLVFFVLCAFIAYSLLLYAMFSEVFISVLLTNFVKHSHTVKLQ